MAFNYWQKFVEHGIYHIYNRSVEGRDLFRDEADYQFFLHNVKRYLSPYTDLYAYCLMPNHFHLLLQILPINRNIILKENTNASSRVNIEDAISYNAFLEDQMRRLFSSFVLKYKQGEGNFKGALFQKRFKRVQVLADSTFLHKLAYVHHNPIHHGYTLMYETWKYSSYNAYCSEKETALAKSKIFQLLGDGDMKWGEQLFLDFHASYKMEGKELWQID